MLQPMDYLFGPLKRRYYKLLRERRQLVGRKNAIPVKTKIKIWSQAWQEIMTAKMIQDGWAKIGIFPARLNKALDRLENLRKDKGLKYMAPGDKLVSSAAKELSNQMRDGVNVKKRKKVRKRKDDTVRNLADAFENGVSSSDDDTETDDELAPQAKKKKTRRTVDHGRFITSQEYDNNLKVLADVAQEKKRKSQEAVIARREAKKAETRARKEAEKESRNAAKKAKKSASAPLPPPPPPPS